MASTLGMVGPFAASLLGGALLAEPLSATQLAGGAVVIAGVSMSRRG
jgi:drug/metabolite transporter (DMT)-like permease